MTNEEMFTAIITRMDKMESGLTGLVGRMDKMESGLTGLVGRMDKMESGLTGLAGRMDKMESGLTGLAGRMDKMESRLNERIDKMESKMNMEFWAVRMEMDGVDKSLKKDISILNDKVDRLMYTKDVDGYEKMKIQVDLLTQGYQNLKEKVG